MTPLPRSGTIARMRLLVLFLALLAPPCLSWAQAPARRVAVLEFQASWSGACGESRKLRPDEVEACEFLGLLADEARAGALQALPPQKYVVMTRENTAQLMKDAGLSPAGTEGESEVETARLIGADLVLSGIASRLSNSWVVTAKLHDVKSAALLGTAKAVATTTLAVMNTVRTEVSRVVKEAVDQAARDDAHSAGPASRAAACPAGQVRIRTRCCWPGQEEGPSGRCEGIPRCPAGTLPLPDLESPTCLALPPLARSPADDGLCEGKTPHAYACDLGGFLKGQPRVDLTMEEIALIRARWTAAARESCTVRATAGRCTGLAASGAGKVERWCCP